MKHLSLLLLLFTLVGNALAAPQVCVMEHEIKTEQAQDLPCHNTGQDDVKYDSSSHICDCDKCAQYVYTLPPLISSALLVSTATFKHLPIYSLETGPDFRPPILISR